MEGKSIGIINYGEQRYDPEETKPKILFSIKNFEDIPTSKHSSHTVYPLKIETSYKQWVIKERYR